MEPPWVWELTFQKDSLSNLGVPLLVLCTKTVSSFRILKRRLVTSCKLFFPNILSWRGHNALIKISQSQGPPKTSYKVNNLISTNGNYLFWAKNSSLELSWNVFFQSCSSTFLTDDGQTMMFGWSVKSFASSWILMRVLVADITSLPQRASNLFSIVVKEKNVCLKR